MISFQPITEDLLEFVLEILNSNSYYNIRIGILQENIGAKKYWTSLGFKFYNNSQYQGNLVECFEKRLT